MSTNQVTLPARIDFDGKGGFKPGIGMAGYTIFSFESIADRDLFMRLYPGSAMPCWKRVTPGVL